MLALAAVALIVIDYVADPDDGRHSGTGPGSRGQTAVTRLM